jgi:putative acetyltransferase
MIILEDDLSGPEIAALLREHVQQMFETSPPDSIHTLSLEALREPAITMWSAWEAEELMGCGALRELDADSGEIKSMRTASAHLGRGVATAIMKQIVGTANNRAYRRLYVETGTAPAFRPAHSLY